MTTIDKATANALGEATRQALEQVAADHGLTVKVGGGTYDPGAGTFRPKVEYAVADSAAREFAQWAEVFGLEADDLGQEFTTHGRTFAVSGVSPRSPKRPILATEVGTDRTFKFAADDVARLLGRAS